MRSPILITGAARSGTSLTAGIIAMSGAFGGNVTGPTNYNKKGQFENTHIRQNITKPYLESMSADKLGQRPLPDIKKLHAFPELQGQVERTMRREGYVDGPWYYKGAKMCLVWPVWHAAFPGAKWIVVRRNAEDIAASCLRTPFMRAFKTAEGWVGWVHEHEKRFQEMDQVGSLMEVTEIHTERLIAGDLETIKNFVDSVDGLTWNEAKVRKFIEPALWKGGN